MSSWTWTCAEKSVSSTRGVHRISTNFNCWIVIILVYLQGTPTLRVLSATADLTGRRALGTPGTYTWWWVPTDHNRTTEQRRSRTTQLIVDYTITLTTKRHLIQNCHFFAYKRSFVVNLTGFGVARDTGSIFFLKGLSQIQIWVDISQVSQQ